jgi:hypothetical protein
MEAETGIADKQMENIINRNCSLPKPPKEVNEIAMSIKKSSIDEKIPYIIGFISLIFLLTPIYIIRILSINANTNKIITPIPNIDIIISVLMNRK